MLSEHLQRQLTLATSNTEMLRVGEEIIGNIDDAGFLKVPLVEVAQSARVEYEVAQATLDLIQTFDPVGVAARDLARVPAHPDSSGWARARRS